jgi:uncharacterized membrane protein
LEALGKIIMFTAVALFLAGVVIYLLGRAGGGFLPGDVVIRRENFTFVFPIVTMIVVSVVLTVVLNLILRR